MPRFLMMSICFLLGCIVAVGCNEKAEQSSQAKPTRFEPTVVMLENGEPSHISVQHVLIGFKGSLPGKPISRTREEAETLAKEILDRAKSGEDFDELVVKYTDDQPPGIYRMANFEQQSFTKTNNQEDWVYPRGEMVAAFGDVGFPLQVGEIGMAPHDVVKSPFGWHIIKRLQ